MSCTTCGGADNCGCGCQKIQVACGCGNAGCNGDCGTSCCQSSPPTAEPFYACVPSCPEDHTQKIYQQTYSFDAKILDSWNVPACGLTATITIPSARAVVVGSYFWNPTYGFFEVTAFNPANGRITLLNHCNDGNAAPGTNVPACTEFTVTVPPCDCGDIGQTCVAIDFTAPDVDDCIDITLTNTEGIASSDTVQIGSGFYRVEAVKPNNVITICNDGSGITPGTSVIALDSAGNFNYCLSIISTNFCDRDPANEGALVICDEGVAKRLSGNETGYIPVLINPSQEIVEFRPVVPPPLCTHLFSPLAIVAGTANYNLVVDSTAGFIAGDILTIAGIGFTERFLITVVTDATHLAVTATPVPPSSVNVPAGELVCMIGCCEQIQNEIDDLPGPCSNEFYNDVQDNIAFNAGTTHLTLGNYTNTSSASTPVTILNASTCRTLRPQVTVVGTVSGVTDTGAAFYAEFDFILELQQSVNGGAFATVATNRRVFLNKRDGALEDMQVTYVAQFADLVALGSMTLSYRLRRSVVDAAPPYTPFGDYNITASSIQANIIGLNL